MLFHHQFWGGGGGGEELFTEPVQGNLGIWEENSHLLKDGSSRHSLSPHAPGEAPLAVLRR